MSGLGAGVDAVRLNGAMAGALAGGDRRPAIGRSNARRLLVQVGVGW